MQTSQESIKRVQGKILQFEESQILLSETETRRALIDPIFASIGWDTGNPNIVRMEWRKDPGDKPVDYAFMINGVPKLLIEAERLKENITDKKWSDQLLWYSSKLGVKWCALANGNIIRIYNSLAEEAAIDKLLFEIEVKTIDTTAGLPIDTFMEKLSLLSEESLKEGKIDAVWDSTYTTRKVFDYLKARKEALIEDIIKNVKLTKKSVGEVLDRINLFLEGKQPPPITPSDYVALFDTKGRPVDYTSKKPSSLWFKEITYDVNSWAQFLLELCNIIKTEHRDRFDNVLELKGRKRLYFTRNENQLTKPKRIPSTDIFIETNLSARNIAVVCGCLLDRFGCRKEDLRVKLRNT